MALTKKQRAHANLIYGIGLEHGLAPNRAAELVAAAYAESGLDPGAVNKSSGAAGFFQLLSPHYRERAEKLGGLHDPVANTLAIIGDYVTYWKRFPKAAPGAAGRDVERSGLGADFYSKPLSVVSPFLQPGSRTSAPQAPTAPVAAAQAPNVAGRQQLASQLIDARSATRAGRPVDYGSLLAAAQAARTPVAPQTPAAATTTRKGAAPTFEGRLVQPIAGKVPTSSAFNYVDPEGMPDAKGTRRHGAVDWFGAPGTPVVAPWDGEVVEVKVSKTNSGQVFGGVVKVRSLSTGYVFVARHVDPRGVREGQRVAAGTPLAGITAWKSGSPHAHIEVWKTLEGGYTWENALDPIQVFGKRRAA